MTMSITRLHHYVEECRSPYTIRYRLDRWWLYRNATPLEAFATGARALKALREIQGAAIVPDHILGEIAP